MALLSHSRSSEAMYAVQEYEYGLGIVPRHWPRPHPPGVTDPSQIVLRLSYAPNPAGDGAVPEVADEAVPRRFVSLMRQATWLVRRGIR